MESQQQQDQKERSKKSIIDRIMDILYYPINLKKKVMADAYERARIFNEEKARKQ